MKPYIIVLGKPVFPSQEMALLDILPRGGLIEEDNVCWRAYDFIGTLVWDTQNPTGNGKQKRVKHQPAPYWAIPIQKILCYPTIHSL